MELVFLIGIVGIKSFVSNTYFNEMFFSFQQKQVLCHLPLPLHEWPIAPRPHIQLVKV